MPVRCTLIAVLICAAAAFADDTPLPQPGPMPEVRMELEIDSGWLPAPLRQRGVVYSTVVTDPDAMWLRLSFSDVTLGAAPLGGQPTVLVTTSLADGASQTMQAHHVEQWRNTSAYFNGHAVLVQVIADPGAAPSRVVIDGVWMGVLGGPVISSLCSSTDQRVLLTDGRLARTMPLGCTSFMIDDPGRNFLTAGHCGNPSDLATVQFNVPMSLSNGNYQHPGPEHQYSVDLASVQRSPFNSLGNDWTFFAVFPNTETGLRPHVAQGEWFDTMVPPPAAANQNVTVSGYGQTSFPVPNTWNGVLKTHDGPYTQLTGTTIRHRVDTTGGNSGSPIIDIPTDRVFGIHTNGGCTVGGATNAGMALSNAGLQDAIALPQGQAIAQPDLVISFPGGVPTHLDPAGTDILVSIAVTPGYMLEPSSPTLYLDTGSGWSAQPLTSIGGFDYIAAIPAIPCGSGVRLYISADAVAGPTYRYPEHAPVSVLQLVAADTFELFFADDFEADLGWTVVNDPMLADGNWERGLPFGDGSFGDPVYDADGSGRCYLTANRSGQSDVQNGATRLISPVLDATDPDAVIAYFRWFSNSAGDNPYEDPFFVEVSDDAGASWVNLETVGPGGPEADGGWYHRSFRVADIPGIAQTDQFRIRFIAQDFGPPSIVEAAVDGVELRRVVCDPNASVPGDLNGDGLVTFEDLLILLSMWGPCAGCPADLDDDGVVNFSDLVLILSYWSRSGG